MVYYGPDSTLVYVSDAEGNRIPDFSYAGYKNSEAPIPDIAVVKEIAPIEGDNTDHIKAALAEVAQLPVDNQTGFRGALLLTAGEYEVKSYFRLYDSGVVLRGVGDGDDPATNTIIKATGNTPAARTVVIAGGGLTTKWNDKDAASVTDIISDTVRVGDRKFRVANASYYNVGDNIIIYHPCTDKWLAEIGYGGTASDPGWAVDEQPIVYNRYIKKIVGDTIFIDAPVFNHLIRDLSQSYIYKYRRVGLKTHIGIENLRIDIVTAGGTDEAHAWNAIDLYQIEDAWVRNCTMLHFTTSGIRSHTASRITVENCRALDPVSVIEGEKRYNFNIYTASQLILFKDCQASNGRHHYVSNGTSWTSGCVFLNCTSQNAYTSSEGHRRWTTGLLYDNHTELNGPISDMRLLGLYNRGDYGTGHGWATAHCVAWGCDVAGGYLIVQKPPTAQNYAIGCFGIVSGNKPPAPFAATAGYIEGTNVAGLEPRSLFLAQLKERLDPATKVESIDPATIPSTIVLHQNYPNPFNPSTIIVFELNKPSHVRLEIYDILGERISILGDRFYASGNYAIEWNGRDHNGIKVPGGVYFYTLITHDQNRATRKMILIK